MKILTFSLMLVVLLSGCAGKSVPVFNDQGIDEEALATVSTHDIKGLFGTSMVIRSVDGVKVGSIFGLPVESVKVTPGRHTYEVKFRDLGYFLGSLEYLIKFEFDADAGNEYFIHIVASKTMAQRFTFKGKLSGWIENKATGEKLPMIRPSIK